MKEIDISEIEWEQTGDVLDKTSVYDWTEVVLGFDKDGRMYEAVAEVCCDDIIDIYDIEPFNKRVNLCQLKLKHVQNVVE